MFSVMRTKEFKVVDEIDPVTYQDALEYEMRLREISLVDRPCAASANGEAAEAIAVADPDGPYQVSLEDLQWQVEVDEPLIEVMKTWSLTVFHFYL